ncbi:hypothetical protein WA026_011088 [Henosepilachna vigintioctopunctata]|uniref:CRAL-TRIO domain-containing protein n=1 Tax=Henosepilachna vigintioctopunctata TaxID=420089 RepID=A0AAW1U5P6_9CUCU
MCTPRCETARESAPRRRRMALKFEFTAIDIVKQGRVNRKDIEEIKEWLKYENLPDATDEQVVLFLLSCDSDIEKTKSTILAYYKYRNIGPNISNNRDINCKELKHIISTVESGVIPNRTKENYMVLFGRLKNFSYWNFHLESSMKYLFMTLDMGLQKNPPDGVVALFDMKGMGLMHLTKLRVGPLKIFFHLVQEGLPCQIRDIHVLNSAYFIDKLLAIIKPFMKKELVDMLHFHQSDIDMEEFFANHLEADCVPSDYGGKSPSVEAIAETSLENMKKMTEWFDIEEEMRKNYKPQK